MLGSLSLHLFSNSECKQYGTMKRYGIPKVVSPSPPRPKKKLNLHTVLNLEGRETRIHFATKTIQPNWKKLRNSELILAQNNVHWYNFPFYIRISCQRPYFHNCGMYTWRSGFQTITCEIPKHFYYRYNFFPWLS